MVFYSYLAGIIPTQYPPAGTCVNKLDCITTAKLQYLFEITKFFCTFLAKWAKILRFAMRFCEFYVFLYKKWQNPRSCHFCQYVSILISLLPRLS